MLLEAQNRRKMIHFIAACDRALCNVFTYVCCNSSAAYVKVAGLPDLKILAWGSFHLVWQSAITRKISFVTEYTQGAGALHTDRVHKMMVKGGNPGS